MSQNTPDTDNIPAPDYLKEGENVTGGSENNQDENQENNTETPEPEKGEYTPTTETTKEEMTGYNELPEQEKVGGG